MAVPTARLAATAPTRAKTGRNTLPIPPWIVGPGYTAFGRVAMVAAVPRRHKAAPPAEELYAPIEWRGECEFEDIIYEVGDGIAKISINRPEVRNAFRPPTLAELRDAFNRARDDIEISTFILTGAGTEAFCSGGDQRIRGDDGYIG